MNSTNVNVRESNGKTVVEIDTQNIDFRNCEMLKNTLKDNINPDSASMVLNMKNVVFVDSSGLSLFLFGKQLCEKSGGQLAVCDLQDYVLNLMTLTHLDKAIKIYPDESQALAG